MDGPLLDVNIGSAVGGEGGGINSLDPTTNATNANGDGGTTNDGEEEERVSRRWFVEEGSRMTLPSSSSSSKGDQQSTNDKQAQQQQPSAIHYSGLDASLLHLSQIWTRGGANISNNLGECFPFQGVLGFGQGASVAGLLPLLNAGTAGEDSDDDDENEDEEDQMNGNGGGPTMFQGLQFVVMIDGQDILSRRKYNGADENNNNDNNEPEEDEKNGGDDCYVGPEGVQSLHIIADETGNDGCCNTHQQQSRSSSEQLARKYGPNAKLSYYKPSPPPSNSTNDTPSTPSSSSCTPPPSSSLSNILGKFLVSQKNAIHSSPQKRQILSLQNQLSTVEQLATLAISNEIQRNPPKALMAVIGPAAMMNGSGDGFAAVSDGDIDDVGNDDGVNKVKSSCSNGSDNGNDILPVSAHHNGDDCNNNNSSNKATTNTKTVNAKTVVTHQEQQTNGVGIGAASNNNNKYNSRVGGGKENEVVKVDKAVGAWHGARRRGFGE